MWKCSTAEWPVYFLWRSRNSGRTLMRACIWKMRPVKQNEATSAAKLGPRCCLLTAVMLCCLACQLAQSQSFSHRFSLTNHLRESRGIMGPLCYWGQWYNIEIETVPSNYDWNCLLHSVWTRLASCTGWTPALYPVWPRSGSSSPIILTRLSGWKMKG